VLTHGHFDHVGSVRELVRRWRVPVYAHELEMPYLTGRSSYPPPDPAVGGGAMATMSRFFPKKPINLGDSVMTLPADGSIPVIGEWRWIHTPGHAPGHVSLFRDYDRALVAATPSSPRNRNRSRQCSRSARGSRPAGVLHDGLGAAEESVETLAELHPEVVVTGTGSRCAVDGSSAASGARGNVSPPRRASSRQVRPSTRSGGSLRRAVRPAAGARHRRPHGCRRCGAALAAVAWLPLGAATGERSASRPRSRLVRPRRRTTRPHALASRMPCAFGNRRRSCILPRGSVTVRVQRESWRRDGIRPGSRTPQWRGAWMIEREDNARLRSTYVANARRRCPALARRRRM
jgi:hypothetical protein